MVDPVPQTPLHLTRIMYIKISSNRNNMYTCNVIKNTPRIEGVYDGQGPPSYSDLAPYLSSSKLVPVMIADLQQ